MSEAMERLMARRQGGGQSGDVLDAIMRPRPFSQDEIVQLPAGQLHSFNGHTFQLRRGDDPYMLSLLDSIRANGILEPLLVRPHPSIAGGYEIIAGHTRRYLGALAGLTVFPCIVRTMDDLDAVIQMGESNLQRPDWLPSEKARTYKAHLEAVREKRREKQEPSSCFYDTDRIQEPGSCLSGSGQLRDLAAKRWGITGRALEMYIKLNDLIPDLLRLVDEGRITVKAGFHLAFLSRDAQRDLVYLLLSHPNLKINEGTARELRQAQPEDLPYILGLLGSPVKTPTWSIALPRELLGAEAKRYLTDPELQGRIAAVVRDYVAERAGEV